MAPACVTAWGLYQYLFKHSCVLSTLDCTKYERVIMAWVITNCQSTRPQLLDFLALACQSWFSTTL